MRVRPDGYRVVSGLELQSWVYPVSGHPGSFPSLSKDHHQNLRREF